MKFPLVKFHKIHYHWLGDGRFTMIYYLQSSVVDVFLGWFGGGFLFGGLKEVFGPQIGGDSIALLVTMF